jgi:hypothetical protein
MYVGERLLTILFLLIAPSVRLYASSTKPHHSAIEGERRRLPLRSSFPETSGLKRI